jgi:hypothetical protein
MEGEHAMRDWAVAPRPARSQRWAGGVIALLLLMTCWGAWVCLLGFRPCALSSLFGRSGVLEPLLLTDQQRPPPDDAQSLFAPVHRGSPS